MNAPRVTVLMPVYNGARYLREAIDSILSQTYGDFEFLIINDGSTDESAALVESYTDHRIRLVHNDGNMGLIATLNRGIELSRGEYIARMDCDDISLPLRLAKQVEFMDQHQDVGVCGTWLTMIGRKEDAKPPIGHDAIVCRLMFESALLHPTVMLRRGIFFDNSLYYDPGYPHAEDFELWVRCAKFCKLANIGEVLLYYRIHSDQVSEVHSQRQLASANLVRLSQVEGLGIVPTPEEKTLHYRVWPPRTGANEAFLVDSGNWLMKLKTVNSVSGRYRAESFEKELARVWFNVCIAASDLGLYSLKRFFRSPLSNFSAITARQFIGIFVHYIIARKRT